MQYAKWLGCNVNTNCVLATIKYDLESIILQHVHGYIQWEIQQVINPKGLHAMTWIPPMALRTSSLSGQLID